MGVNVDVDEDRRWQLVTEYRRRIRMYAWLLTFGVPLAFVQWHDKADTKVACGLAMAAQFVFLVLIMGAINHASEYRKPSFPTPEDRKTRSTILGVVWKVGFALIAVTEFFFFAQGVWEGWKLPVSAGVVFLVVASLLYLAVWWPTEKERQEKQRVKPECQ